MTRRHVGKREVRELQCHSLCCAGAGGGATTAAPAELAGCRALAIDARKVWPTKAQHSRQVHSATCSSHMGRAATALPSAQDSPAGTLAPAALRLSSSHTAPSRWLAASCGRRVTPDARRSGGGQRWAAGRKAAAQECGRAVRYRAHVRCRHGCHADASKACESSKPVHATSPGHGQWRFGQEETMFNPPLLVYCTPTHHPRACSQNKSWAWAAAEDAQQACSPTATAAARSHSHPPDEQVLSTQVSRAVEREHISEGRQRGCRRGPKEGDRMSQRLARQAQSQQQVSVAAATARRHRNHVAWHGSSHAAAAAGHVAQGVIAGSS